MTNFVQPYRKQIPAPEEVMVDGVRLEFSGHRIGPPPDHVLGFLDPHTSGFEDSLGVADQLAALGRGVAGGGASGPPSNVRHGSQQHRSMLGALGGDYEEVLSWDTALCYEALHVSQELVLLRVLHGAGTRVPAG
jgi:hypothetical protein